MCAASHRNEDMMNLGGLKQSVETWLKAPYDPKGSVLNWILFIGLVLVAVFMWSTVLREITKG